MKNLFLILFIFISSCSFDNKTGIWKNSNESVKKSENIYKDFKTLYTDKKLFNEVIYPDKSFKIKLNPLKKNLLWVDEFYQNSNNLNNFSYKNQNNLLFKSRKLIKNNIKDQILFDGDNIIFANKKGFLKVFSVEDQQIIFEYNFYNKNFKKIKKNLNFIIDGSTIYISDNLGYLYAINYKSKKLLWAKNFKIPFRSNIKILKEKIIISDTNNTLYFINKLNGDNLKIIPTEETTIKNNFINSIAVNENSIFYLNTYGSLYSINYNGKINWFINLNQSLDLNPSNLFNSNPIVLHNDKIAIATQDKLYFLNTNNGATIFQFDISSLMSPIVTNDNILLITANSLLVCINTNNGKINYSIDINFEIAKFLDVKEKEIVIRSFSILNNNIFLFLQNSYILEFENNGKLLDISKLPAKLNTSPIFINDSLIYFDKKNRVIISN